MCAFVRYTCVCGCLSRLLYQYQLFLTDIITSTVFLLAPLSPNPSPHHRDFDRFGGLGGNSAKATTQQLINFAVQRIIVSSVINLFLQTPSINSLSLSHTHTHTPQEPLPVSFATPLHITHARALFFLSLSLRTHAGTTPIPFFTPTSNLPNKRRDYKKTKNKQQINKNKKTMDGYQSLKKNQKTNKNRNI